MNKLEEIINAKIAEMGHVWEVTADRSVTPVLLTPAAEEGADAWELRLKGTRHPDWQITHRRLSRDEAEALQAYARESPWRDDCPAFDFYIRDGRGRGWNRSLVAAALPRRRLDPKAQFTFTGELRAEETTADCPYSRHVGVVSLDEGKSFEGDPRTRADVLKRHSE